MEITLKEDNGLFFDGVPTLVVVDVVLNDGRRVKFPYEAGRTISDLYLDLSCLKVPEKVAAEVMARTDPPTFKLAHSVEVPDVVHQVPQPVSRETPDPNKIEKGDIVRCIFLENRNDHAGNPATIDLAVGGMYRVTKVVQGGFMVLDDHAPMKFNLFLARHEVELAKKGEPIEKKKLFLEEGVNCPKCNTLVYCGLHNGFYIGKCECGQGINVSRKDFKDGQRGNTNSSPVEPGQSSGSLQEAV